MARIGRPVSAVLSIQLALSCLVALAWVALTIAQHVYGYQTYTILSGSMRPTMPVGTLVVTHAVAASQVHVGDVITFHPPAEPNVLVTHRVYAVQPPAAAGLPPLWVTKGDANPAPDLWRVPAAGTPQRMVAHLPDAGYISTDLQSPMARLVLLFVPATLLCLLLLVELWRPKSGAVGTDSSQAGGEVASQPQVGWTPTR